jgi:hypothetical protein
MKADHPCPALFCKLFWTVAELAAHNRKDDRPVLTIHLETRFFFYSSSALLVLDLRGGCAESGNPLSPARGQQIVCRGSRNHRCHVDC